ncbi:MAG: peroxisomal assembly protein [Pycnora praestabilis]|nr:MAG: peroxisomal assembly protein [Pycnora praestabilis]
MAEHDSPLHHRKRRRRRRTSQDRPAISAHLTVDEGLKGDVGILSDDLYRELFPDKAWQDNNIDEATAEQRIRHVAICPWTPLSPDSIEDIAWTIIPVRAHAKAQDHVKVLAHSTVQFPASSLALQSFAQSLHAIAPAKLLSNTRLSIEIRILDVVPLGLDTLFVNVDGESLRKLDEVHRKFGGGFGAHEPNSNAVNGRGHASKGNGPNRQTSRPGSVSLEQRLRSALREALKSPKIVHSGDLVPLPMPHHPITHAPPPPAKITVCEPVSQGLLLPQTKIVLTRSHHESRSWCMVRQLPAYRSIPAVTEEEDEDTSNEQFFSAAEDKQSGYSPSSRGQGELTSSDTETSAAESGDMSDDSLEELISLNAPTLPPQSSGILSSFNSATPRVNASKTNGISTPGSVFSNYSATTARAGVSGGKFFRVQGLLQRIPDEALHPKPISSDDDEARVFVDVGTLVKLGCFSGDWVKLEASTETQVNGLASWSLGIFDGVEEKEDGDWRAARVYSLSEFQLGRSIRYPMSKSEKRHTSHVVPSSQRLTPKVYVSPIMLANLNGPSYVKLSPMSSSSHTHSLPRSSFSKSKITNSSSPPLAKEVKVLKIYTPLSSDRALQNVLFLGLKQHFEVKQRVVKSGDLIGISIDQDLGRVLFRSANDQEDENTSDELMTRFRAVEAPTNEKVKTNGVAWFMVGHVTVANPGPENPSPDVDMWGGLVMIDSSSTILGQVGSEQRSLPGTIDNPWQYYFRLKQPPRDGSRAGHMSLATADVPKIHITHIRRRLRELVSAATSLRAIHLGLKPVALLLASSQRNIGKATVARDACADLGLHVFTIDAYDIVTEGGAGGGDMKTEAYLQARAERALSCGPEYTAILIQHVEALTADRMVTALKEVLANSRIIIATTTEIDKLPDGVRGLFTHELEMSAPDEGEREGILRRVIDAKALQIGSDVDLAGVAIKTAALVAGDLVDVVERALVARRVRLEALALHASKAIDAESELIVQDIHIAGGEAGRCVIKADFDFAVDAARKNFADSIGAPKIPNVSWDDVGGLSNVKDAVMETIQLPLERPELFVKGMKKRSGILFYGPPGTGKTLLAKAIATEFSLNFFSVKGPELLNMYIGESEANVRRVFQRARDARPCVVFFDELDSVAPKRGNQGDSGGVMDRIVSQLLAELDGMSDGEDGGGGVFVIGATNRPDLLDQALLRPGRFDKMLYLGVSDTHDKQLTILEALTRKFTLHPALSLRRVAELLPFTYTGADLYALCSDAMLKAITRQASAVDEKIRALPSGPVTTAYFFDHLATKEDLAVLVTEQDFVAAQRELVGSVSAKELEHYSHVRKSFETTGDKNAKAAEQSKTTIPQGVQATSGENSILLRPKVRSRSSTKGKGKGKGAAGGWMSSVGEDDPFTDKIPSDDDDNDHHIIRTQHLSMNGNSEINGSPVVVKRASRNDEYDLRFNPRYKDEYDLMINPNSFGEDPSRNDDEELYS